MVDLTIELLKQIRDGVQVTNARIDQTRHDLSARIDETNVRFGETNARLDRTRAEHIEHIEHIEQTRTELSERIDQTNARLEKVDFRLTGVEGRLTGVEGQLGVAVGLVRILADKDERLAVDVADLRRRVEALENSASQ